MQILHKSDNISISKAYDILYAAIQKKLNAGYVNIKSDLGDEENYKFTIEHFSDDFMLIEVKNDEGEIVVTGRADSIDR